MCKYLPLRSKFRPGPKGTGRPEVGAQVVQPEVVLERTEQIKKACHPGRAPKMVLSGCKTAISYTSVA